MCSLIPNLQPFVHEDKAELHSELLEEFRAAREARQWTLEVSGVLVVSCVIAAVLGVCKLCDCCFVGRSASGPWRRA